MAAGFYFDRGVACSFAGRWPTGAAIMYSVQMRSSAFFSASNELKSSQRLTWPSSLAFGLATGRACRGRQRRRLLDLGLIPGTAISAEFVSPSGDPVAYRVRNNLLALRQEQADLIFVAGPADKRESPDHQPTVGAWPPLEPVPERT